MPPRIKAGMLGWSVELELIVFRAGARNGQFAGEVG